VITVQSGSKAHMQAAVQAVLGTAQEQVNASGSHWWSEFLMLFSR